MNYGWEEKEHFSQYLSELSIKLKVPIIIALQSNGTCSLAQAIPKPIKCGYCNDTGQAQKWNSITKMMENDPSNCYHCGQRPITDEELQLLKYVHSIGIGIILDDSRRL